MQRKYTFKVTDSETNAVIYNAKGDLANGGTYNGTFINATTTPATVSVTFSSTGALTGTNSTATTWVDTIGTDDTPVNNDAWIGGSNYRITWLTPTTAGALPDTLSPTGGGNQLLSSDMTFTGIATSLGRQEATYLVSITNIITSAQQSWTVNLTVEASSVAGGGGGGDPGDPPEQQV